MGEATSAAPHRKTIPRAKTTAPSGNLGQRRSALLEAAAEEPAPPPPAAPAPPAPPMRVVTPPPLDVEEDE